MSGPSNRKLFILSIDGVPHSLMNEAFSRGVMPNFQRLVDRDGVISMNSVIPVISSVAWATFSTGVNPGKHGIFGFVDRDADLNYRILTAKDNKARSLWRRLNDLGKRVVAINVPGTYPPEPIDGIVIGDFISPSIEKASYPNEIAPLLRELNYIIDADPLLAQSDRSAYMQQLFDALRARRELTLNLLESEDWDLFMLHIMETDRINHFFWDAKDNSQNEFHNEFWDFYRRVDDLIGLLADKLDEEFEFMILSDHGFCKIDWDVDLNSLLVEQGFASFEENANMLAGLDPSSHAYALTPGRIYLNLEGRESRGSVRPSASANLKNELTNMLLELKDSKAGKNVIERVWGREEIYSGPLLDLSADLIAHPNRGYDLKAGVGNSSIFKKSVRSGMHTFDEALLYCRNRKLLRVDDHSILDATPLIFNLLGLSIPTDLEGSSPLN
jgi:predicted AlkP superfamily phosphohydrolase/phosphomutase